MVEAFCEGPMASRTHSSVDYEEIGIRVTKPGFKRKTWLIRAAGIVVLLGLFIGTSVTLGRKDNLHKVLLWIHQHRAGGFFIFCLLYIWFTVLFLPPALLAGCAGAIYGFLVSIPLVWVCAVLGETVSFLLGRFLLKKWVKELTADWPMWTALDAALSEDGWKLVALLRVSPVVPFSILNYALGSSSLPFAQFWWPSVFGIIPGLIIYVYLGSLAADISEAISAGPMAAPPAAKIAIIVVGGVSVLLVVVLSTIYTRRAINKRLASLHLHEQVSVEEQHYLLDTAESGGGPASGVVVSVEEPHYVVDRHMPDSANHSRTAPVGPNGAASASGRGYSAPWKFFTQKFTRTSRVSSDDGCDADGQVAAVECEPLTAHAAGSSSGGGGMASTTSRRQQQQQQQQHEQHEQHQWPGPLPLYHGNGTGRAISGVAISGNSCSSKAMQRRGSKGDLQQ